MHPFAHVLLAAMIVGVGPLSARAQQSPFEHDADGGLAASIDRLQGRAAVLRNEPKAPIDPEFATNAEWCKRMQQALAENKAGLADARKNVDKADEEFRAATLEYRKAQETYDRDLHGVASPERVELRRQLDKAKDRYNSAEFAVEQSYEKMRNLQGWVEQESGELAAHDAQCKAAAATPPKQPPSPSPKPAATPKPAAPRKVMTFPIPVGFFKVTRTYRERWDEKDNHLYDEVQVPNTVGKWVMWAYPEERRGTDLIGGRQVATVVALDQNGGTLVATFDAASVMGPYKTNTEFCPVVQDLFKRGQLVLSPLNKKYTEVLLEPCQ